MPNIIDNIDIIIAFVIVKYILTKPYLISLNLSSSYSVCNYVFHKSILPISTSRL